MNATRSVRSRRPIAAQTKRRVSVERGFRPLERRFGDVELRFNPNGTLDEVVLMKAGECVFHLEYLDNGHVWMGLDNVHVNLYSANSIRAEAIVQSSCGTEVLGKKRRARVRAT